MTTSTLLAIASIKVFLALKKSPTNLISSLLDSNK